MTRVSGGFADSFLETRNCDSRGTLPFSGVGTAIYVQDFTGGEGGFSQEQNCIDDFFDLADHAERV
jgi:hypothetical protein